MALRSKAASKTEYDSRPFTKSNLAGRSFCLGVMPIPCPHFKITIVKRSQGQSAVAGAAYQSGERLFSEYDQRTKFYNKKKELVHAEIMLPSYAPPGYADRATLWNAVEAVENQWNSQLARRIVLAFPVEVPKEQYLSMIKEFCQEQFVSKGMIADFAIRLLNPIPMCTNIFVFHYKTAWLLTSILFRQLASCLPIRVRHLLQLYNW